MRGIEIIYADENIIAVNKPPGVVMHRSPEMSAQAVETGFFLTDFLLEKFPEISRVGDEPKWRPGLVHRLDKDTSGVAVIARNQKSFLRLKYIFQNRLAEKKYLAVVCGKPKRKRGVISFPIGRLANNPTKRGVEKGRSAIRGAREAVTEYEVLRAGEEFSLLELRPKTGRTHQLRVHLKAIGHPVACDKIYGGAKVCCPEGCSRQLLHANYISFEFSLEEEKPPSRFRFEADPPEDFESM